MGLSAYPARTGWYDALCSFISGCDLLLHDAMFTDTEYERYEGWGHSTYRQALQLAQDAGVARLQLFHHSPERTDTQIERIVDQLRDDAGRSGVDVEIGIAAEGEELLVEEHRQ